MKEKTRERKRERERERDREKESESEWSVVVMNTKAKKTEMALFPDFKSFPKGSESHLSCRRSGLARKKATAFEANGPRRKNESNR